MELLITTQLEPNTLPEVQWNHEELKKYVADKAAEYATIAYTEDQAKEMKSDRATMNKFVTAMEDQRKQVKKYYEAPYKKFEEQVKDVLQPMRDTIGLIDANLREIDDRWRVERTALMKSAYAAAIGDLDKLVPFEKLVDDYCYKKSTTDKKVSQFYIDKVNRIRDDMKALEELPERFRDKATLEYLKAFSLSDALREGKRLEDLETEMERRRKERYEREQAELEAARAVEREARALARATPVNAPAGAEEASEELDESPKAPEIFTITFTAAGTKEQLMSLRQFMIDNNIQFNA